MSGNGTIENPWDLATALQTTLAKPDDIFWMRGGGFVGEFTSRLNTTSVFRPYQSERPIVDGGMTVQGSYVIFRGLEITYSGWTTRETAQSGGDPTDIPLNKTLNVTGSYIKFINCVFHDLVSPFCPSTALGIEFDGCLFYHCGWKGSDRGHGHGLYIQNDTPVKTIKDCILFDNFGFGIHIYTENGTINNVLIDGCTSFNNGSLCSETPNDILVGGWNSIAANPIIKNCMTLGAGGVNLGYNAGVSNAILQDNYFVGGITKVNAEITTETGNYYGPAIGNQVFLRTNDYDANRANLTIYNEAGANTIDVDVSSVFGASGTVKAYNVQDYFTDIQTLTITAGVITVNMQAVNRTVATPRGWTAPATTFPTFGCFVLVKQ